MNPNLGKLSDRLWPFFSKINILMVLDGRAGAAHSASFGPGDPNTNPLSGDSYFGLSEVIRTLTAGGPYFAEFSVTKAHRDTDPGGAADIETFRFDQHNLSVYDEIWLIGVAADYDTNAVMSDAELAALTTFMNSGGGVFATGDHEDLGVVMNGRVPRVRSMRKWYFNHPGPHGEPLAPPGLGSGRHETTQPGHNDPGTGTVLFDDQSDDIPQPIVPRWYTDRRWIFTADVYPHPLLCSSKGVIKVLPDHMHEGEVIVPWDLTTTFTFNGQQFVEYPTNASGEQVVPEIVAWGNVLSELDVATEGAHTGDPNNVATAKRFGVIGAYDGHAAGVGRVSVDSTWHHFFDINLVGDPVAPYPKTLGFKASPSGLEALSAIQSYYRNIGTWLARPNTHRHLLAGMVWYCLRAQPLKMLINPTRRYSYQELTHIGSLAIECLYRIAPPCSVLVVLWNELVDGPVRVIPPDPWQNPGPGDPPSIDPALILRITLASAVVEVARQWPSLEHKDLEEAAEGIKHAVRHGVHQGLRVLGSELASYSKGLSELAHSFLEE